VTATGHSMTPFTPIGSVPEFGAGIGYASDAGSTFAEAPAVRLIVSPQRSAAGFNAQSRP